MPNYAGAIARIPAEKHGERVSVLDYGALSDLVFGTDGAITASTNAFGSTLINFTPGDIGKMIWIEGAGASGNADHLTTIADYNSAHSIEIASPALFTVTGAKFRYFTDNLAALTAAHAESASRGFHLHYTRGAFGITESLLPYDNLYISGDGFTNDASSTSGQGTILCCCSAVPIIYSATQIRNFCCHRMTFIGTSRSGSRGLDIGPLYGLFLRDLSFTYFGDQGVYVHSPGQGDGEVHNVFAVDVLKVRSRAEYAGGLQFDLSDLRMLHCQSTTSVTFEAPAFSGGRYGDGRGAGIMISANQCFALGLVGHGSQIGIYLAPTVGSSLGANSANLVNCRTEYNQGPGWVVDGAAVHLVNPRALANSYDATGTFPAYLIRGGQCHTQGAQSSDDGGSFPYHKCHIETDVPGDVAGGQHLNCHPFGRYAGPEYVHSGVQQDHVVAGGTINDPVGVPSFRIQTNLSHRDKAYYYVKSDGPTDEKVWSRRFNYGSGFSQIIDRLVNDDYDDETAYLVFSRTGMALDFLEYLALVKFSAGLELDSTLAVTTGNKFLFSGIATVIYSAGDPNGVITAEPSSLAFDGNNGYLWFKRTGSGNIGWVNLTRLFVGNAAGDLFVGNASSTGAMDNLAIGANGRYLKVGSGTAGWEKVDLASANSVENALAVANGGTGATTQAAAQTSLDVYSKADVDSAINAIYTILSNKADKGANTTTVSGHSHVQQ